MNTFVRVLLWIWQLPQNLIGLIMLLFIQGETRHKVGSIRFYYAKSFPGGITLGEYIIVGTKQELTVKHEYGHILQSRYLGPLYLIVIGLPSLIHAWLNDTIGCCMKDGYYNYYHFYTESWAEKLGKVNRPQRKSIKSCSTTSRLQLLLILLTAGATLYSCGVAKPEYLERRVDNPRVVVDSISTANRVQVPPFNQWDKATLYTSDSTITNMFVWQVTKDGFILTISVTEMPDRDDVVRFKKQEDR